jgi:hypothetical protein
MHQQHQGLKLEKTIALIFLCAFAALREKILKKDPRKDGKPQSSKM